jgi:hypothetical protein
VRLTTVKAAPGRLHVCLVDEHRPGRYGGIRRLDCRELPADADAVDSDVVAGDDLFLPHVLEWLRLNKFECFKADGFLGANRTSRHGEQRFNLYFPGNQYAVAMFLYYGFRVPTEHRGAVADAICRANWGFPHCTFKLDMSDGELPRRRPQAVHRGEVFPGRPSELS